MSREPIRSAYAQWSEQYDRDDNRTRDLALAVLERSLPELDGRDVLELGAGTGQSTARLLSARSVTALDFSEDMLAHAKARIDAPHVRFLVHDLCEPWPFEASKFDLISENLVLEHIQHLEPVFREARRVLRPGGALLILELHPYRQLAGKQARFDTGRQTVLVPAFVHPISEFVSAARASGFLIDVMGEWLDGGRPAQAELGTIPRVLSLMLRAA